MKADKTGEVYETLNQFDRMQYFCCPNNKKNDSLATPAILSSLTLSEPCTITAETFASSKKNSFTTATKLESFCLLKKDC
jgi:hypothetical protein